MKRIAIGLALFVAFGGGLKAEETTVLYGYVSNVSPADYLAMAKDLTDGIKLNEIYGSIAQRTDLSVDEKTSLLRQVGDIYAGNVDKQGRVETAKIIAEGVVGASVQVAAAYIPNGALGGAVDGLGQAIVDGNWNDISKVTQSMTEGAVVGAATPVILEKLATVAKKAIDPKVLKPVYENLSQKVDAWVRKELTPKVYELSDLYLEVNQTLRPKLGEAKGELAELYKKAKLDASDVQVTAKIAELEKQVQKLEGDIKTVDTKIGETTKVVDALEKSVKRCETLADNLVSTLASKIEVGGYSVESVVQSVSDPVFDYLNSQVKAIAEGRTDVPTTDGGKTDKNDDGVAKSVVDGLKKQLTDSLPKDVADEIGRLLDSLDIEGLGEAARQEILKAVQRIVSEKVPDYSAAEINKVLQDLSDGTAIDPVETTKDLGRSVAADALKDVIDKNLDPEIAKKIDALIDGYMKDGAQGLSDAALAEINKLIDQYAPGTDSAKALKDAVSGVVSGTASTADLKNAATAVASDGAKKLIDESNLPDDVKKAAKEAVDGLAENGINGLTSNMRDFISDYVADKLGSEAAGEAVGQIFDAIVTPGADPWQEIVAQAQVIGQAVGQKFLAEAEKVIADQIDKVIEKYPALKAVLDRLGIDGTGIVNGFVNVLGVLFAAPDLSTAIQQLSGMAVQFLKDIAAKLIDWALEWAVGWLNNTLIPKVCDWASAKLGDWANATDNKLIQQGLEWLKTQCEKCKKCGGIKIQTAGTGQKVVDYIEGKIKSSKQPGTTVLKSK